MNFISADNISKSIGERIIFDNCTLGLNQGERVALVGVNGAGKTTLLKILAKIEPPDSGQVSIRKDIKVGYLFQEPQFDELQTVLENVLTGDLPQVQCIRRYEQLLFGFPPKSDSELEQLIEQINHLQAWDFEREVQEILSKLGLGHLLNQPVGTLSGGQRKRVATAKLLIQKPDVLLLDEPTNHLDIETIEWLENIISKNFKTLIMVSHDRYFLDSLCNTIVEIDQGKLLKIKGNYAFFLEKKAQLIQAEEARQAKLKNLLLKELEWVKRQPKARGTKSRSRLDAFELLKEATTQKRIDIELELPFKAHRQGGKILELRRISKKFEQHAVIKPFSYNFQKGEKVGIVGKNGSGKSTLLRIITGELQPDTGDVVIGETTVFGFYKQEITNFNPEQRLIDYIKSIAEHIELENGQSMSASAFLSYFLFKPEQHYTPLGKLSGGERKRLQLVSVLIKNPNFLILDEPTNDLDINTLNVLEDFLNRYKGTTIVVSHDRYFMDKVVDHLLVFEGDGHIEVFNGNFTDLKVARAQEKLPENKVDKLLEINDVNSKNKPSNQKSSETPATQKRKLTFKEKQELDEIITRVNELETTKHSLTLQLQNCQLPYQQLNDISKTIQEIDAEIELLTFRWLELEELSAG